jgi:hypothetical protein
MVQNGTEPVMQTENIIQDGDQYLYTTGGFMSSRVTDTFTFQFQVLPTSPLATTFVVQPATGIRAFKLEILYTFLSTGMFIAATLTITGGLNAGLNSPATVYQLQVFNSPAHAGPREFKVNTNGGTDIDSYINCDYGVLTKQY